MYIFPKLFLTFLLQVFSDEQHRKSYLTVYLSASPWNCEGTVQKPRSVFTDISYSTDLETSCKQILFRLALFSSGKYILNSIIFLSTLLGKYYLDHNQLNDLFICVFRQHFFSLYSTTMQEAKWDHWQIFHLQCKSPSLSLLTQMICYLNVHSLQVFYCLVLSNNKQTSQTVCSAIC